MYMHSYSESLYAYIVVNYQTWQKFRSSNTIRVVNSPPLSPAVKFNFDGLGLEGCLRSEEVSIWGQ